ncbi:sigma factor [Microtetraspora niveoalba]|uniref:sigma factor n=1 Tax=Microtetraspora niveoalba TaxID=46175 RepID=UPI00082CB941|nr:sigma factor [Microtetraspora niveoalba]
MGPPDTRRHRFEKLYQEYHDAVLAYLVRRTKNGQDAADALAETFLVAWRRLADVPAGERARPWLLVGVPLTAVVAVAGMVALSVAAPDQRGGPVSVGPHPAAALSFQREGGYLRPHPDGLGRDQVKPEWYVHDAVAGAEGRVILFVGPEKE